MAEATALKSQLSCYGTGNITALSQVVGVIVFRRYRFSIKSLLDSDDRFEQRQRNLRTAYALTAFRIDHQRYPDRLEELVPKHIDAVPIDLFRDKPLLYSRQETGYLLYSVGPDERDDAGEESSDDIVVRFER